MRNYSSGYTVQIDSTDKQERRIRLITQLENCTNHIRSLQERLRSDITKLKPIELERLLDDYRAEQIRYDNLSRELDGHNTAAKTAVAKERWRKQNRDRRKKLHY